MQSLFKRTKQMSVFWQFFLVKKVIESQMSEKNFFIRTLILGPSLFGNTYRLMKKLNLVFF